MCRERCCALMIWKKKNRNQMTIQDYKKEYKKNLKYRYAVCVGKDNIPIYLCETTDIAKSDAEIHINSGGVLPVEIIDLAFY